MHHTFLFTGLNIRRTVPQTDDLNTLRQPAQRPDSDGRLSERMGPTQPREAK